MTDPKERITILEDALVHASEFVFATDCATCREVRHLANDIIVARATQRPHTPSIEESLSQRIASLEARMSAIGG